MARVVEGPSALAEQWARAASVSVREGEYSIEDILEALEYTYALVQRHDDRRPARKLI